MNRITIILLAFILTACGVPALAKSDPMLPTPTISPIPTATVDYQATAAIAQATADESRRMMVEITAEHDALAFNATSQSINATMQADSFTATAAPTIIPFTMTVFEAGRSAAGTERAMISTQMVMTQNAPTQMLLMHRAEQEKKFMVSEIIGRLFLLAATGYMMIAIGWFLFNRRNIAREYPTIETTDNETTPEPVMVTIKQNNGGGFAQYQRLALPCTSAMLTELAQGIISGQKTLAINNWEGKNSDHWTRETFGPMRAFLLGNRFAQSDGKGMNGALILTDAGREFFEGWLDTENLPPPLQFSQAHEAKAPQIAHAHEAHTHEEANFEKYPA